MSASSRPIRWDSFNEDPENYHLGRPGYPPEVYRILTGHCGLGPGCRVLEIGPGTGQATAGLLEAGAEVVAVERGPDLAAALRHRLPDPRLRVIDGDITEVALPEAGFDLVVCATAFHWLDTDAALQVAERALRSHGALAVWWNVFGDHEQITPFRRRLDALYARHLPECWVAVAEVPRPMRAKERAAELRHGGYFGPVTAETVRWNHRMTSAGARRLFATFPNIRVLPQPRREAFLDLITALMDKEFGGVVDDPLVTAVYTTRRVD